MKKYVARLSAFVVATLSLAVLFPVHAFAFSGSGAGNSGSPYMITTCLQLQEMQSGLGAYYKLANDIDCSDTVTWNSGAGFAPVGNSSTNFTGTLDGDNFQITNLTINRPSSTTQVGLIGWANGATLKNIRLDEGSIKGGSGSTGALLGYGTSLTITNVYSSAPVTAGGSGAKVGGLVGWSGGGGGTMSQAAVHATVTSTGTDLGYVGGVIGISSGMNITNAFYNGNLTDASSGNWVGGIAGATLGTLTNAYATGTLSYTSPDYAGGLLGSGNVQTSFSTMALSGGSATHLGAIAGAIGTNTTNAFDQTAAGTAVCAGMNTATACTAVNTTGSDPLHFAGTTSAVPLSSWNFSSVWRSAALALPVFIGTPSMPDNVRVVRTSTTMTVSWDPAENGGSTITSYQLRYKPLSSTGAYTYINGITPSSGTTSQLLSGLTPNTEYLVYIRARTAIDAGTWLGFTTTTNATQATSAAAVSSVTAASTTPTDTSASASLADTTVAEPQTVAEAATVAPTPTQPATNSATSAAKTTASTSKTLLISAAVVATVALAIAGVQFYQKSAKD